jgi:hypothetical protein
MFDVIKPEQEKFSEMQIKFIDMKKYTNFSEKLCSMFQKILNGCKSLLKSSFKNIVESSLRESRLR